MSPIKTTSLFVKFSRVTALIFVVTVALVTIVGSGSSGDGSQSAQGAQGFWIEPRFLGDQSLAQAQGVAQLPEGPPIILMMIASNGDAAGYAPGEGIFQMHGDISAGSFGDEVDTCNGPPNGVVISCISRKAEVSGTARWYDPDGFLSNEEADYAVEGTVTEWLEQDGEGEDGEDAFIVIEKTMVLVIFDDSVDSFECLVPMTGDAIGAQALDPCDPLISVANLHYVPEAYEFPSSNELTEGDWSQWIIFPDSDNSSFLPPLIGIVIDADGNINSGFLETEVGCTQQSLEIQPYNSQFNVYHVSGSVICPAKGDDVSELVFSTDGLAFLAPCNILDDGSICVGLEEPDLIGVEAHLEAGDLDWLFMALEAHVDFFAEGDLLVEETDISVTTIFQRFIEDLP